MENSPDKRSEAHSQTSESLSVQQLNQRISDVVDASEPLQNVCCYGEVMNLGGSNAALYFTLTDSTHELPYMLWRSRYRNMDIELGEGLRSHDTALYILLGALPSGMNLEETGDYLAEELDLERSAHVREVGQSVAELRD